MAHAGFYSANGHRAYPFTDVPTAAVIPETAVVDFGVVAGLRAVFTDALHRVWLYRVARAGSVFTFEFRSDAPGCAGRALLFERDLADPEYATTFAVDEAAPGEVEEAPDGCVDDPVLEGFLVTGSLADLAAFLPDGDEWTDETAVQTVEPALVQNLARTYVRQVSLANKDRTRVDPPDGCSASSSAAGPEGAVLVNATCLTGELKVKEGYNCVVRVSRPDNSITISGQVGAGEGEACDEVALTAGERPPAGSVVLTGGPKCNEILKSINGVGGRVVRVQAGGGVRVVPGDAPHTLVIEADLHGMALCAPLVESSIGGGP